MRDLITVGVALAFAAGVAQAEPSVEIRGVAARVAIIPQARRDVRIAILKVNHKTPIRVRRSGSRLLVTGDVSRQIHSCGGPGAVGAVSIKSRGVIAFADLPQLVIYTPRNVRLLAGDAVFGVIGRSDSVDFTNLGCGTWRIANVRGRLRVDQAGSGVTRAGTAGSGDLAVAGSGLIATQALGQGLMAVSSGSGDITVARVSSGAADVRIAGTGNVTIDQGHVGPLTASIAGSGDVRMGGVAQSLVATVTGSGNVVVAKVTGEVKGQAFGAGKIKVGR
jgi:hypothetical protein